MPASIPQLPPARAKKPTDVQPPKRPAPPKSKREEPRFRDVLDGAKRHVQPKQKEAAGKPDGAEGKAKSGGTDAAKTAENKTVQLTKVRGKGKAELPRDAADAVDDQVAAEAADANSDPRGTMAEKMLVGNLEAELTAWIEAPDGPTNERDDKPTDPPPAELPYPAAAPTLTQFPSEPVDLDAADLPPLALSEATLDVSSVVAEAVPHETHAVTSAADTSAPIDRELFDLPATDATTIERTDNPVSPQSVTLPREILSEQHQIMEFNGESPTVQTVDGAMRAADTGAHSYDAHTDAEPDAKDPPTVTTTAAFAMTRTDVDPTAAAGEPLLDPAVAALPTHKADLPLGMSVGFQPPVHVVDPLEARFAESNHPRIVTAVRSELMPSGGTVRLRLDPPELGALQVRIDVRDGVVAASFQTSNDEATRVLTQSLQRLKTTLESQGVTVEKLHVQQAPREQWDGGRGGSDDRHQHSQQQEQQRREMLQRMWRRVRDGRDPFDLVA